MIAWDALLGSRRKSTYRVTAGLTALCEDDAALHVERRAELADIYDKRSRLVHGDVAGVDLDLRNRAIQVGLRGTRSDGHSSSAPASQAPDLYLFFFFVFPAAHQRPFAFEHAVFAEFEFATERPEPEVFDPFDLRLDFDRPFGAFAGVREVDAFCALLGEEPGGADRFFLACSSRRRRGRSGIRSRRLLRRRRRRGRRCMGGRSFWTPRSKWQLFISIAAGEMPSMELHSPYSGAEGELVGGFGELAGEGRFAALDFDGAFFGAEGVQTWASEGGGVAFGFQAGSVGAGLEWEREGGRGQQRGAKRRKRGGAAD